MEMTIRKEEVFNAHRSLKTGGLPCHTRLGEAWGLVRRQRE